MTIKEQVRYLMQGTEYGDPVLKGKMTEELEQRLTDASREGRPLRVYCGFDPTKSDLHIGHTVPMGKLRQFQDLGHDVTFLVGTCTATIGDPSDQDVLRPKRTEEQTLENGRTYAEQAMTILDRDKTEVHYNHEWLPGLSFTEIIEMMSSFSVQQMLTRDAFRRRWDRGEAVYLHETLYSLMQGYDACHLRADVQVGGSDQTFNIVTASRKLMTVRGLRPNVAIIMGILPGTDGRVKMSKSLGNHIPILSSPEKMYGKVMSIPDEALRSYFALATRLIPEEIDSLMSGLNRGALHPKDVKMRLAREIVTIYHNSEAAAGAEKEFKRVFQEKNVPEDIPEIETEPGMKLLDVLVMSGMAPSRSEGRRLITQGAVRFEGEKILDPNRTLTSPGVLQVGKRRFLRLVNPT